MAACFSAAVPDVSASTTHPSKSQATGTAATTKSVDLLRSAYIKQIQELHELLDVEAISEEDFTKQKVKILALMNSL